jgi:hypothetical protein
VTPAWAAGGAVLLAGATLPQFVRLLRHRRADDFGWAFIVLNFVGLALLAVRSIELGEAAVAAINTLTCLFWGTVGVIKLRPPRSKPPPRTGQGRGRRAPPKLKQVPSWRPYAEQPAP